MCGVTNIQIHNLRFDWVIKILINISFHKDFIDKSRKNIFSIIIVHGGWVRRDSIRFHQCILCTGACLADGIFIDQFEDQQTINIDINSSKTALYQFWERQRSAQARGRAARRRDASLPAASWRHVAAVVVTSARHGQRARPSLASADATRAAEDLSR